MELIDVFQKTYGASYQESRRLYELKNCRYTIWIVSSNCGGGSILKHRQWTGLRLQQLTKYSWYFRYRAALIQIENPKFYIYFSINKTYEIYDQRTELIQTIKNKLTNAKGKLTQATLRINTAKTAWNSLFPIEEHPSYIKMTDELEKRKERILELDTDLITASNQDNIFDLLKKHNII